MGKESITLSMELPKTQSHEFECFVDNYSLTISTQGCRINTRKFNTKGTYSTYPLIRTYFFRFSLNGFLCKWCLVEF